MHRNGNKINILKKIKIWKENSHEWPQHVCKNQNEQVHDKNKEKHRISVAPRKQRQIEIDTHVL